MTEEELRRRWKESMGERERLLGEEQVRPLRSRHLAMHARQLDQTAPRRERLSKSGSLGRCLDSIVRRRARQVGCEAVAAELGLEPVTVYNLMGGKRV